MHVIVPTCLFLLVIQLFMICGHHSASVKRNYPYPRGQHSTSQLSEPYPPKRVYTDNQLKDEGTKQYQPYPQGLGQASSNNFDYPLKDKTTEHDHHPPKWNNPPYPLRDEGTKQHEPYPLKWEEAPSSISDYPLDEKHHHVIDPWIYTQRLGLFKIMVIETEKYFRQWGYNNTGNLLWGLPLQFGWQMTSHRLQVQANPKSKLLQDRSLEFTPNSWWADMNYYLSVIPFLGAVNAGIVPIPSNKCCLLLPQNVTIALRDKFCTSVTQCESRYPDMMKKWTLFFIHLHECYGNCDKDTISGLLWDAHTTTIAIGNVLFTDELKILSIPEMHFGRGWALLVDFIAATHFQTNLNNTYKQQILALPPRILHSGDSPPHIPDFTKYQNNALKIINIIYTTEKLSGGDFLILWKKAMCSAKGREDGRNMLESLLEHPIVVLEDVIKLILDFIKDHKC